MYAWISCSRTKPLFAFTCSLGGPNKRTEILTNQAERGWVNFERSRRRENPMGIRRIFPEELCLFCPQKCWVIRDLAKTIRIRRQNEWELIQTDTVVVDLLIHWSQHQHYKVTFLKSGFFKWVVTKIWGFERPTLAGASSSWSLQANLVLESISWVLHSPTKQHCTNAVHVVHFYLFHL